MGPHLHWQDPAISTWYPRWDCWDPAQILAAYLPTYNVIENPMKSSVRDHDAFSNDKT